METNGIIQLKDKRTGKTYCCSIYNQDKKEFAIKKLQEKMDYDWFESLPAKDRVEKKKHNLDFTCPFCLKKTKITSRKEKITSGFLFFISTTIVDIFKCQECDKEFREYELDSKKGNFMRENIIMENFENWKDAKRDGKNPPEFASIDRIDEVIISSLAPL